MNPTTATRTDLSATTASRAQPGAAGAADPNAHLVRRYFAAISERDKPESLLDLYTTDEQLKRHVAFFESAFPKYSLIAEDVIAQDDKVAVRARFQGTHSGDLMGLAPTMKTIDVPFIIIYRIADSKIAEHWMSIDQSEVLKQLGTGQ
jgi:predicted ester cyclase